jgi:hypothetical protein
MSLVLAPGIPSCCNFQTVHVGQGDSGPPRLLGVTILHSRNRGSFIIIICSTLCSNTQDKVFEYSFIKDTTDQVTNTDYRLQITNWANSQCGLW